MGHRNLEIEVVENNLLELKKQMIYYEVYIRFYNDDFNNEAENIEFIFNDFTKTKIINEQNSAFKHKSLILSKIADEF